MANWFLVRIWLELMLRKVRCRCWLVWTRLREEIAASLAQQRDELEDRHRRELVAATELAMQVRPSLPACLPPFFLSVCLPVCLSVCLFVLHSVPSFIFVRPNLFPPLFPSLCLSFTVPI